MMKLLTPKFLSLFSKRLSIGVLALVLSACATQQSKVNADLESFKRGNLAQTISGLDESIPAKNNVYYLERGTVLRLMGQSPIPTSSQSLLLTDQVLRQSELKRMSLKASVNALGDYLIAENLLDKDYELKGYEGSLLAYHIALNHVLQGDWDNGRVEVMKMVKREQDLASYNNIKYQALQMERTKVSQANRTNIDNRFMAGNPMIGGYPVNTLTDPEVNTLKNSYQSAAAHYLAGFIFEKLKEGSLAAPGYRQAIELRPELAFLKQGLNNLDSNLNKSTDASVGGSTDTLVVIETGFLPLIDNFKVNIPIPIGNVMKFATVSYPRIQPNTEKYYPNQLRIDSTTLVPEMITSVDAMARKDLKDAMPGYVLRASSRAFTQVLAQVAAEQAAMAGSRDKNQSAALGALASLVTGITMSAISSADVRHWSSLPSNIFMVRVNVPNGLRDFSIMTPAGIMSGRKINFSGDKALVYVRLFRDRATIMSSGDLSSGFQNLPQPIAGVLR